MRDSRRQICGLPWQASGDLCPSRLRCEEYTSFKIGGPADVVVEPADIEDVCLVVQQARARKIPLFVLGGTNLLIRDGGIRGIVVSLVRLRAIKEEPGSVLYAEGGVGMPTLIGYAIRHSLAGLEWAAGIPGTVAGCVVMNAGTKLGEMKDSVKAVRMVNMKGRSWTWKQPAGRGSSIDGPCCHAASSWEYGFS